MTVGMRLCALLLAASAMTACSSGGSSGSSDDGPTSGLADPDVLSRGGVSDVFVNSQRSELAIIEGPIVAAGRKDLPASGSASYSGFGTIFDSALTSDDNTAARLRNRSVVTDVTGTATFGASPTITIAQSNFRDVDGNAIAGNATWTATNVTGRGLLEATVSGNVGGTAFSTNPQQARVGFHAVGSQSAVIGNFTNAPVTAGGWLQGSGVSGDFAATGNIVP